MGKINRFPSGGLHEWSSFLLLVARLAHAKPRTSRLAPQIRHIPEAHHSKLRSVNRP